MMISCATFEVFSMVDDSTTTSAAVMELKWLQSSVPSLPAELLKCLDIRNNGGHLHIDLHTGNCPSVFASDCLSVYASVYASDCASDCLSDCLSIYASASSTAAVCMNVDM